MAADIYKVIAANVYSVLLEILNYPAFPFTAKHPA